MERHWLDWCRLCANDYATVNVCNKELYVKIISKVFDVEIGFEEPALGAKLCNECYSLVGDLVYFIDNVNKVQPIFELLRHTEPNEALDVRALRQQYGLPSHLKGFHSPVVVSTVADEAQEMDVKHFLLDDDTDEDDKIKSEDPKRPEKRKRGRPKSVINLQSSSGLKVKSTHSINVQMEPVNPYEVEEDDSHSWLVIGEETDTSNICNRIGDEHDESVQIEKLECAVSYEHLDILSHNDISKSPIDSDEINICLDNEDYNESQIVDTVQQTIVKRKPGRPPKNRSRLLNLKKHINASNCKNLALEQLLASPQPETHMSENLEDSNQGNRRQVKCHICNKELASEASLKNHNERVHMKKKPVVCDCCGKRVSTSSELREHMLVHTDDTPFACPLCNASFKNQKRLNVHSQTHGKPKFECQICGKKLQTRANWNKHKYVHSEERRFTCSICGTGHKHSTALKVHLLSHTGFRPYACKYCNKAFASSANCKDHKKKKHPMEYAKDDDKSSRINTVPTLDELRALADSMEKGERLRKPRLVQK